MQGERSVCMNQVVAKLEGALIRGSLRKEDLFSSTVFYFLAGCFPNLSMEMCCDAVDEVRKIIKESKLTVDGKEVK